MGKVKTYKEGDQLYDVVAKLSEACGWKPSNAITEEDGKLFSGGLEAVDLADFVVTRYKAKEAKQALWRASVKAHDEKKHQAQRLASSLAAMLRKEHPYVENDPDCATCQILEEAKKTLDVF